VFGLVLLIWDAYWLMRHPPRSSSTRLQQPQQQGMGIGQGIDQGIGLRAAPYRATPA
jgi:hypothetical protein